VPKSGLILRRAGMIDKYGTRCGGVRHAQPPTARNV